MIQSLATGAPPAGSGRALDRRTSDNILHASGVSQDFQDIFRSLARLHLKDSASTVLHRLDSATRESMVGVFPAQRCLAVCC